MKIFKSVKSQYGKVKAIRLNTPIITRILLAGLFLFILSFFFNVKMLAFLFIVIFVNISMENVRLRANLPADFELSTFSTVLVSVAFGWKWGILTAIFSKLITSIATGNVLADHFFMIGTYINAAIWAAMLGSMNIFALGVFITIMNCIIMWIISAKILGLDPTSNISYTGTNLVFNFIVFSIFSEIILSMLK